MRVLVLADTHVRDGGRPLDDRVLRAAAGSDLVLHAGDVTGAALLDRLGELAPVRAVLGNNDVDLVDDLPERLELDLAGVSVAVVHDSGARAGRPARLRRWFPSADLIVFGHSHVPEDTTTDDGARLFNPGSPTQRRRAPTRTYGVLEVADGRIVDLRHQHLT
ncbi:metallophosphoesterase family protein [Dermatobacter hominis]|uniref:metallophosphoesterase family protein n=1 Tax=Dermatobacter hominis TaxID=2884263 RepID=UPI001D100310|nr:metallophosphoesterase family protein [Dermatobacter hominis]UDY35119.1 metallophosphatase family protein [Dermatobacter hominis]